MLCAFTSHVDITVKQTSLYSFECDNGLCSVLSKGPASPQVTPEGPPDLISPALFEVLLLLLLSSQQGPRCYVKPSRHVPCFCLNLLLIAMATNVNRL